MQFVFEHLRIVRYFKISLSNIKYMFPYLVCTIRSDFLLNLKKSSIIHEVEITKPNFAILVSRF